MSRNQKYTFLVFLLLFITLEAGCGGNEMKNVNPKATTAVSLTPTPKITGSPSSTITPVGKETASINSVTPAPASSIREELDEFLCGKNEEVLFGFDIEASDKTVSVCTSKDQSDYIVYRFGTSDKVELEYPDTKDAASWSKFTYSYYLRGGGAGNEGLDLNYLIFDNGGYEYQIYSEYSAAEDETRVGITVTDLDTGDVTDIKGKSDSIQGSLIALRDNEKINTVIQ